MIAKPTKILVVEDDPGMRRLVQQMFANYDYRFFPADSPRDAKNILQKQKIDLIVLDLLFPGGDIGGCEFLKSLKSNANTKSVPIVIISGEFGNRELARCLELGAADCFRKPFSKEMFIAKIEQLLRGESKHKEPNANAGTSLVLHIEDDDAWAELVRLWLSNKGSAVHRVSNRMQMRRFLSQITQIPDCIIMDIELDSTDGLQLCDELKENSRFQKIPLLIFSGRENMQLPGLKHMAVTVIQKRPEAADELMAAVKSVLAQQERTLGVLEVGTLRLDPRGTSPIVFDEDEQLCTLDRGLFSILRCLVEASPAAVADAELRRVSMRREDYRRRHSEDPAPKTVGSYVYELRRHLGRKVARRIVRIHGLGYAYVPPGGDE